MCSSEQLKINLKDLDEGRTALQFRLDDAWFGSLEEDEIKRGEVCVSVDIRRTESYFELDIHTEGSVVIPCDLCLDDMDQDVESDDRLIVKFGEEYSEDDDLITVDEREGVLDVAWFIYEFIALNIPAKHVHTPGKCNAAMIKVLEEHSATRSSGENEEAAVDPRWNGLEKLKTIIKD